VPPAPAVASPNRPSVNLPPKEAYFFKGGWKGSILAELNQFEWVAVGDLRPYENNSKRHPEKQITQLQKSIEEFGFISPLLIDNDNRVIAGHGRLEAAKGLRMDNVPCVRVEGLTEEQRRAYIIADNRISELGSWDKDMVAAELSTLDILDFDISLAGFDESILDSLNMGIELPYGAERERTTSAYNMELQEEFKNTNDFWQMPVISKTDFVPSKLIGFNYAKSSKEKQTGIHFFIDDYQFERVWNDPEKYIDVLKEYECILSPDFSLYLDMATPLKIWNIYRSRFIGAFYQSKGIEVIPTVSWAGEETFDFCFEGIEEGGTVAVSTIGVKQSEPAFEIWRNGMNAMIERIKPQTILVYGGALDFDYGDIKVIYYDNQVLKAWKEKSNDKD